MVISQYRCFKFEFQYLSKLCTVVEQVSVLPHTYLKQCLPLNRRIRLQTSTQLAKRISVRRVKNAISNKCAVNTVCAVIPSLALHT